jgi:PTH1 family peptidyl-tRNA hydrolase
MKRWVIAGLGNPGKLYRKTRHNAGFWVLDSLARTTGIALRKRLKFSAWLGEGRWKEQDLILIKPASFMNASGPVVRKVLRYFKVLPARLLVVVDDVNLPPGRIRLRRRGGAGGHHGLESIIRELGGNDFPRLRLGIGGGDLEDLTSHVLSPAGEGQSAIYVPAVRAAVEAIGEILENGFEKTMNKYN